MKNRTKQKRKIRVLFIMPMPPYTQNGRFRVMQYAPYMDKAGIEYTISPFVSPEFEKILYTRGNYPRKIFFFMKGIWRRIRDVMRARRFDVIMILRDACPYGPPIFELLFKLLNKNIVYDFDDAIWMKQPSIYNGLTNFLKWPGKIKYIIKMSKIVVCDIPYLEEYARRYSDKTVILKCPIDDVAYQPVRNEKKPGEPIVIGWIGSHSTQVHPKSMTNVYLRLAEKYDNLKFRFIDATDYSVEGLDIELKPFVKEDEIPDIQGFDIGIYPLIDIPYVHGKCGFKTQQYMAAGVPTVNTPLGGIPDFVVDGVNGFIAKNEDEWVEKLSMLIEDPVLRKKIGDAGRATVEKQLSVRINADKFIRILREAAFEDSPSIIAEREKERNQHVI